MKLFNKHDIPLYFYIKGWLMTFSLMSVVSLLFGLICKIINPNELLAGIFVIFVLWAVVIFCDYKRAITKDDNFR
jgi:uncharacterized membrane protein YbhN (UPF0104 family)